VMIVLFVHRPFADDDSLKVIECVTCNWYLTYLDELWTSNEMPDRQRAAWTATAEHAFGSHEGRARIVRGWKP
jgi:hypothetical protein